MKKIILILLTLSLILSLFSCTNTPQTAPSTEIEKTFDPANNGESPFDFILTQVGEVIYKVYPEEGVLVPACPDPLCKHNTTSCPMFQTQCMMIDNGVAYYQKGDDSRGLFTNKICSYDFSTEEYKVLYKVGNTGESMQYFLKADKYMFFNIFFPYNTAENIPIKLMRYDIESGEIIVLADSLPDYVVPIVSENGRVFWRDGTGYYSTDYDYKNKIANDIGYNPGYVDSGYAFPLKVTGRIIKNGGSGSAFPEKSIIRVDLETMEESLFIESTFIPVCPYKGKVIYIPTQEAKLIGKKKNPTGGEDTDVYNRFGSKLYICNVDGTDNRLLCEIPGNDWEFALVVGGTYGCCAKGDYVIRRMKTYQPVKNNPDYVEQGQDRILVVNIVTGEYKILSAE